MTAWGGPAAAGRSLFLVSDDDRELVLEQLKDAFVQGRLTSDEFGARADYALAARTRAELAALTADIPGSPAPARPARSAALAQSAAPARRRPLAKAAAGSSACLALAFGLLLFTADVLGPVSLGNPDHPWSSLCAFFAIALLLAAVGIMTLGVNASVEQRRARTRLTSQPRRVDSGAARS